MGQLVNGVWQTGNVLAEKNQGEFVRPASVFNNWVGQEGGLFAAEKDRYHLYISYACPWAHRAVIMRTLKGLQEIVTMSSVEAISGEDGWSFSKEGTEYSDPLYAVHYLHQIYTKADAEYSGKVTVPVLWDKKNKTIVNNESSQIIRIFNSAFNAYTVNDSDYYPVNLQLNIDAMNEYVYENINNGVYRCGFASTQEAYDEAFDNLFTALDTMESLLTKQTYLVADQITEADWRLFTTLVRFDAVYFNHFKCNLKLVKDYPAISDYLNKLYHHPGICETVRIAFTKQHFYRSMPGINPTGIVPKGPMLSFLD